MPSIFAKLCCFRTRSSYGIYDAANSQGEKLSSDLRRKSSKQREDQGKKNRPNTWSAPQVERKPVEQRKERGRKEGDAAKWRSLPYVFGNEGLDIQSPTVLFYAKGYDKTKIRINDPDRNMLEKGVSDFRSVIIEASMARDGKPAETSTLKGTKMKAPSPRPSPPLSSKKESTVQMFTRIKLDIEKSKKPSNAKENVCLFAAKLEEKSLYKENGQEKMMKREKKNNKEKENYEKNDEKKKDATQEPKSDSEPEDENKREKNGNNKEEPMYQPMHLPASVGKDNYVHMKNLC